MFNGFYVRVVLNNSAFVRSYAVEYLKLVHISFSVPDDKYKFVAQLPMFSPHILLYL